MAFLSPVIATELTALDRVEAVGLLRRSLQEELASLAASSEKGDDQEGFWDGIARQCATKLAPLLGLEAADLEVEIVLSADQSDRWDEVVAGLLSPGGVRR
jgi:hypothetical protein